MFIHPKKIINLIFLLVVFVFVLILGAKAHAFYDCSSYGFYAYSDGLGYCKCMSGYVWGTDYFGNRVCVSGDSKCIEQYGIMSTYDSFSGKCECSYGYLFGTDSIGRTQCISDDSFCRNKLGYNSKYNILTDSCECNYGYELSYKTFGSGYECKSCSMKYGFHSSYDSLLKKCECDNGYTLKDGECVEKHNSAYFKLKEVNADNREAIIKSDYTGSCYHISYGIGCFSSSIKRYVNNDIVVNMGTDFYVDAWDWLVLQNDNEECNLTRVSGVNCNYSLEEDSDLSTYNYFILKQLLDQNSCGNNSALTIDNKCQCNADYQWVDGGNPNNFDCEKIIRIT